MMRKTITTIIFLLLIITTTNVAFADNENIIWIESVDNITPINMNGQLTDKIEFGIKINIDAPALGVDPQATWLYCSIILYTVKDKQLLEEQWHLKLDRQVEEKDERKTTMEDSNNNDGYFCKNSIRLSSIGGFTPFKKWVKFWGVIEVPNSTLYDKIFLRIEVSQTGQDDSQKRVWDYYWFELSIGEEPEPLYWGDTLEEIHGSLATSTLFLVTILLLMIIIIAWLLYRNKPKGRSKK